MKSIERWDKSLDQWDIIYIWVNLITTEACSPEPWNHGLCSGNHPLLWPNNSGSG